MEITGKMKEYITNIRRTELEDKVNCIGYFQSDFFSMGKLMERQNEIYEFLKRKNFDDLEMIDLYNATEHMRVALNKAKK